MFYLSLEYYPTFFFLLNGLYLIFLQLKYKMRQKLKYTVFNKF